MLVGVFFKLYTLYMKCLFYGKDLKITSGECD